LAVFFTTPSASTLRGGALSPAATALFLIRHALNTVRHDPDVQVTGRFDQGDSVP
jgi:hypothetical protein